MSSDRHQRGPGPETEFAAALSRMPASSGGSPGRASIAPVHGPRFGRFASLWSAVGGRDLRSVAKLIGLVALLGAAGAPARAGLVSNIDLTASADLSLSGMVRAQEFTAGDENAALGRIEIKFSSGSGELDPPTATLRRRDGDNYVLVVELTGPKKLAGGDNAFAAPADTTLQADTVYAVRLEGGATGVALRGTGDDSETGDSGWSVGNDSLHRSSDATSYETSANALMIRVIEAGERFDPFEPPLGPILTLSEATSTDGTWTVSWSDAEAGDYYSEIRLEETSPGGVVESTDFIPPVFTTIITGKTVAGDYSYRVRGCRNLCSDWSGSLTVTFDPALGQPSVTSPSSGSNTSGSYAVSWTSVTNATSYVLEEKVGTGSWAEAQDSSSTTKSYSGKALGSYHYRVKACKGSSTCGGWSSTRTVTVELGTPSITSPSSGSNTTGSFTVGWTSVTKATSYELQEKVGTGAWTTVQNTSSRTKSFSSKGLGTYSYQVRACAGSNGCGGWSSTRTVTVGLGTPTITSPSGSSNTSGSYTVGWTSVTNATSYMLEEMVGTGAWTAAQNSSSRTKSYSGTGLGTYKYRVKACAGSSNCGGWSSTRTVSVGLGTPSINSPSSGSNTTGSFTVGWTSVTNATSYELQERVGAGAWTTVQNTSSRTKSFSNKGLGTFSYQVRACAGSNGCGGWSSTRTVTVGLGTPSINAPSSGSNTSGGYTVGWTSVTNATSYMLEEMVGTGAWTAAQNSSSRTRSYSGKGLGTYKYRVKACAGSSNCGGWSSTRTVTVELGTPSITSPSSGSNTSGSYAVGWTSVTNATSYMLEEMVGSGAWTAAQNSSSRTRSYSGKGIGTYKYRVKACAGSSNCGGWSSTRTVTVTLGTPSITSPSSGSNTSGSYAVGWTSVTNAATYLLQEKIGTGAWTQAQNASSRSVNYAGKGLGTYYYRVKACDGSTCGGWSSTRTVTVELGTPSINSPSGGSNTSGSYTVGWTSVTNATSYMLEEMVGSGAWTAAQNSSSRTRSYSGKGIGTYKYRVKACAGSSNCGGWSSTRTVTVTLGTPSITSPSSGSNTSGSYAVGWTSVTNAATYLLQEKIGTGAWTQAQNASSRSVNYAGKGLGTYYYRVKACDGTTCGGWSSIRTVTVTLGTPSINSPSSGSNTSGSFTVGWTSVTNATSYELQERVGTGAWTTVQNTSPRTKSFSSKGLGTFSYQVRACAGSNGCGGYSSTRTVTVELGTPGITAPSSGDTGSYKVSWDSVANATQYELQEKVGSGGWTEVQDSTATMRMFSGKAPGSYMYRVRACAGASQCGGWSGAVTVVVPPAIPTITAPSSSSGTHTVSWTSSTGATSYVLEEKVGAGSWTEAQDSSSTRKEYTGKAVAIYMYRVEACAGSSNCSDWSSTATVKVPPAMPSAITGPSSSTGSYDLSWGSSTGATAYQLQEKVGSGAWATAQNTSSTSKSYTDKAAGTYHYQVRACAGTDNCSDWTATKTVEVTSSSSSNSQPVVSPIADQTVMKGAGHAVEVTVEVTDADGDTHRIRATSADNTIASVAVNGSTLTITGVAVGGARITVTADDRSGADNAVSEPVTFMATVREYTGQIRANPNPSADGAYTLSWDARDDFPYHILLEGDADASSKKVFYPGEALKYSFVGKAPGMHRYELYHCDFNIDDIPFTLTLGSGTCAGTDIPEVTVTVNAAVGPSNISGTTVAGATPYRTGVTQGGDAYVNVPIEPAPGVNGLAPMLSIDYGGGRERELAEQSLPWDTLGYGWHLSGFSTIRRCFVNQPGPAANLLDTDNLCLDGEPLVLTSGTALAPDAVYRLLRERFVKVTVKGTSPHVWFEAKGPDGSVSEYGNTEDSQLHFVTDYFNGSATMEKAFQWSINKRTDAFDNSMSYAYHKDESAGVRHPLWVVYGNGGDAAVEFKYVHRSDLSAVMLGSSSTRAQAQNLLLREIRVLRDASVGADGAPSGKLVRAYRLQTETEGAQRRLDRVQLCGYDETGAGEKCLAPIDVDWTTPDTDLSVVVGRLTDSLGRKTEFEYGVLEERASHAFLFAERPFGNPPASIAGTSVLDGDDPNDADEALKAVVTKMKRADGLADAESASDRLARDELRVPGQGPEERAGLGISGVRRDAVDGRGVGGW